MTGGLFGPIIVGMTTSDYLINALFVFVVLRQARERKLDLRSLLGPLAAVGYVAFNYVHRSRPAATTCYSLACSPLPG